MTTDTQPCIILDWAALERAQNRYCLDLYDLKQDQATGAALFWAGSQHWERPLLYQNCIKSSGLVRFQWIGLIVSLHVAAGLEYEPSEYPDLQRLVRLIYHRSLT